jgi:hypothetical protein
MGGRLGSFWDNCCAAVIQPDLKESVGCLIRPINLLMENWNEWDDRELLRRYSFLFFFIGGMTGTFLCFVWDGREGMAKSQNSFGWSS